MRLKADIGQAFVLDLNSVLARTFTERPIDDGCTPNSKCLCDGRRADALLLAVGQKEMLLPIEGKRAKAETKKADKPAVSRARKRA